MASYYNLILSKDWCPWLPINSVMSSLLCLHTLHSEPLHLLPRMLSSQIYSNFMPACSYSYTYTHTLIFLFIICFPLVCKLSVQFSHSAFLTLCDPMDRSTPGLPVHLQLPVSTQTHVHWVGDAIQPSHPLLSTSPSNINLSQHQDIFQWVSSSHQVAKVLEFKLQHQSFQWTPRTDLL